MSSRSDLRRFVDAQDPVLDAVEAELAAGRKRSHWMWFVFPQLVGLGQSPMARFYGVQGLDEAAAYLADPILGERLRRHVGLVARHEGETPQAIFGSPDDLKFRSCLTLFERAASAPANKALFAHALEQFYGDCRDPETLNRLDRQGP